MNIFILVFLALFGWILQSTVFTHLIIAGVKPDILLILVLFQSIFNGHEKGGIIGFSIGLFEDLLLGRFIGMNALAKGLSSFFVGWIAKGAFRENLLVPILLIFLGTLFNQLIFLISGKIVGLQWSWSLWLWKGLPLAIYNACLVPFFYGYFYQWANPEKERQVL